MRLRISSQRRRHQGVECTLGGVNHALCLTWTRTAALWARFPTEAYRTNAGSAVLVNSQASLVPLHVLAARAAARTHSPARSANGSNQFTAACEFTGERRHRAGHLAQRASGWSARVVSDCGIALPFKGFVTRRHRVMRAHACPAHGTGERLRPVLRRCATSGREACGIRYARRRGEGRL